MNATQTIQCPLPGLEDVKLTINLMGSEDDFEEWGNSLGEKKSGLIVTSVTGWPEEQYGKDPFGPRSPMAFRAWACANALKDAIKAFVSDPN